MRYHVSYIEPQYNERQTRRQNRSTNWSELSSSLTYWGRLTHICVSKLTIIGSDNGLLPGRRQAIIWTNAGILLIRTLRTNFSEILGEINSFSFSKMHLKISSRNGIYLVSASMSWITLAWSHLGPSTMASPKPLLTEWQPKERNSVNFELGININTNIFMFKLQFLNRTLFSFLRCWNL